MAGIYIHIPFCRQKCYYCDFYKTTNSSLKESYIAALLKEIEFRQEYLEGEEVKTIYFGGGTPSVLDTHEAGMILDFLNKKFAVSSDAEITFEANPDDLSSDYLNDLKSSGVNRLSIGIQSFNEVHLRTMNRRHDVRQAIEAVDNAWNNGITNISADLIYGLPGLTKGEWMNDLHEIFRLPVVHLSAYHLTYHKGTPFYTWLRKGTFKELAEADSIVQFEMLLDQTSANGFEHYEISNFARDGRISEHNTSYWFGVNYLGLGPSAHSYNGTTRRWNVAHLDSYINGIETSKPHFEEELLSGYDKYNEYIMTRMRTKWGVCTKEIRKKFGTALAEHTEAIVQKFQSSGKIIRQRGLYRLSHEGLFLSDNIITEFMIV